ncbi:hypothetical protein ASZ90_005973 [hydrocarbon metagenome]|uniref:Uncharacterized protein n=1 Tax=hydrocarbon metagenome TaxID=938273 RepID=A0A0W8FTM6_9ZZZZ
MTVTSLASYAITVVGKIVFLFTETLLANKGVLSIINILDSFVYLGYF